MLRYECAAVTKKGRRNNNQDNYIIKTQFAALDHVDVGTVCTGNEQELLFAAVTDGMGGEAFGERASYLAVSCMAEYYSTFSADKPIKQQLDEAVLGANNAICRAMEKSDAGLRMGSTVVGLCIKGATLTYTNLGDSPMYMLRDGMLVKLTKDHTEGQGLLAAGMITEEELKNHPSRNRLSRFLGIFEDELHLETPAYPTVELKAGDILLLCSDGVSGAVNEGDMAGILGSDATAADKAEMLTQLAFDNGSSDNMTALVVAVGQEKLPQTVGVMLQVAPIQAEQGKTEPEPNTNSNKLDVIKTALIVMCVMLLIIIVVLVETRDNNHDGERPHDGYDADDYDNDDSEKPDYTETDNPDNSNLYPGNTDNNGGDYNGGQIDETVPPPITHVPNPTAPMGIPESPAISG